VPELPEVETVRRGLAPILVGSVFARVEQRRPDLRFPLPKRFGARLEGRRIEALDRRAKYLLARLDDGEVLIMHLGMTGRFAIDKANGSANGSPAALGRFVNTQAATPKHEHIVFHLVDGSVVRYSDVRRFGIMDLVPADLLDSHVLFKGLGVEPLGEALTSEWLADKLKGKTTSIKAALLDQRLIAGLGNIYACEALYRARVSPLKHAGTLATKSGKPTKRTDALVAGIKAVLESAIRAGGSSLRDYRHTDGRLGRFQHRFKVYGRDGKPCQRTDCGGTIRRTVQNGRSTFFCSTCQK
jgi:formamidopyrimidine-DNA glycosylase